MAHTVQSTWRALYLEHCGMAEAHLEGQRPAFELSERIATGAIGVDVSKFERRRKRAAAASGGVEYTR